MIETAETWAVTVAWAFLLIYTVAEVQEKIQQLINTFVNKSRLIVNGSVFNPYKLNAKSTIW